MKLKCYFFLAAMLFFIAAYSQSQRIQKQKCFGGTNAEDGIGFNTLLDNKDGTYIITGNTASSNSGDIIEGYNSPSGGSNIFIAKVDSKFNIIWKRVIGGTRATYISEIRQSIDSGYILIGTTSSTDGDVTGNHGDDDVWIVKLSVNGVIQWQHCYGGTGGDQGSSITTAGNDGYVFVGTAGSQDGDVSGLHVGSDGYVRSDVWLVHININGEIVSQKCFGGIYSEKAATIIKTNDGDFLIGASIEKDGGDVSGFHGGSLTDIWLIKTDVAGNILWSKALGGTQQDDVCNLFETSTGNYIVLGFTWSNDGDVTGHHQKDDAWVVNLTPTGQLLWQKCFGGSDHDDLYGIVELPDKSFLCSGLTFSTNGDIARINGGDCDAWMVRFNDQGKLLWENTYGGTNQDYATSLCLTSDNGILVRGVTLSNEHDVTGNHGGSDIWLFQLGDKNSISGYVFYDANNNGIRDAGEKLTNEALITAVKDGSTVSAIPSGGLYHLDVDSGVYIVTANPNQTYYSVVPAQRQFYFPQYNASDSVDFALQAPAFINDAEISLVPIGPARPGFSTFYKILYRNAGTAELTNLTIDLTKDVRTSFTSDTLTAPAPTVDGEHLVWHLPVLHPQDSGSIRIAISNAIPPALNRGDTISLKVSIGPVANDASVFNDTASLKLVVTGSYDPNDKQEINAGKITRKQVTDAEYLTYLIRFQNTGDDIAFNINVTDTLDENLDWSSLQMIACSHPYNMQVVDGNKIKWSFDNVNLVDSNHNEPASHGYLAYRVKTKPTIANGTTINNTASIYFDFNLPVQTNKQQTTLEATQALPVILKQWNAVLKNNEVLLTWKSSYEINTRNYQVQHSPDGISFTTVGNVPAFDRSDGFSYSFNHTGFVKGNNYYRLATTDADGHISYSGVLIIRVSSDKNINTVFYPNPASKFIIVNFNGELKGKAKIDLFDLSGKRLLSFSSGDLVAASYSSTIQLKILAKGIYIIECSIGNYVERKKLIVQ